MATSNQTFDSSDLYQAWSHWNEYHEFCRMARHRKKFEKQLCDAKVPLTHIPWKSMVRALLSQQLFSDEQLKEMNSPNAECCKADDIILSQATTDLLLENNQDHEENPTETWLEVDELRKRFQRAVDIIPASRHVRMEMLHKILGYPTGYSDEGTDFGVDQIDDEPFDLTRVLSIDEQRLMRTGDLIELSGNRLHDAFYIYRLPQKGIWAQIQQMWLKHQITDFVFDNTDAEEEIIFIPAMDEYGYGVPYLFTTRPTELLPSGALHKYVDINCPLVAIHTQNPTIALVQGHLNEGLINPVYRDRYMKVEMRVQPNRFPQQYVALVHINDAALDNILWTQRAHYDGKHVAIDLNDNRDIFFSRRILEAEEQYHKSKISTSSN